MNELSFSMDMEKVMTVKEIAEAMGVSTDTVKNCIRRIISNKMKNGKTTFLNEQEVAMISKELKSNAQVTNQLTYEAGSQVANTTTRLEVLANYKAATEALVSMLEAEKAELKAKIEADKPLVDFAKAVTDSEDCIDMAEVAKVLNYKGIGRNKMFEILRAENVLNRKPYQKFVDSGYFRVIETSWTLPDGTQKINLKTLVLQKGVKFIDGIVKPYVRGKKNGRATEK